MKLKKPSTLGDKYQVFTSIITNSQYQVSFYQELYNLHDAQTGPAVILETRFMWLDENNQMTTMSPLQYQIDHVRPLCYACGRLRR